MKIQVSLIHLDSRQQTENRLKQCRSALSNKSRQDGLDDALMLGFTSKKVLNLKEMHVQSFAMQ